MFCGLPIKVAAEPMLAAQASPIRKGKRIDAALQAQPGHHRRHGQADDVVGEHRRQPAGDEDQHGQQAAARQRQRGDTTRDRRVKAAQAHLRRHHHEGEQQHDRRQVHGARRVLDRLVGEGDDRDRAEQGHARTIELQSRQAAEEHAQVDHPENGDDAPVTGPVAQKLDRRQMAHRRDQAGAPTMPVAGVGSVQGPMVKTPPRPRLLRRSMPAPPGTVRVQGPGLLAQPRLRLFAPAEGPAQRAGLSGRRADGLEVVQLLLIDHQRHRDRAHFGWHVAVVLRCGWRQRENEAFQ